MAVSFHLSWKHEEKKIGATHVHLLADSNGPHARGEQKLNTILRKSACTLSLF